MRISTPIDYVVSKAKSINHLFKLMPSILDFGGGITKSTGKLWRVFATEGWNGVKRRILFVDSRQREIADSISTEIDRNDYSDSISTEIDSNDYSDSVSTEINRNDYSEWMRRYDLLTSADREKIKLRIADFQANPLISVLMPVGVRSASFLDAAIQSVRDQLYPNWELCITDTPTNPAVHEVLERHRQQDPRIKVNSALELAQGEFVALFNPDDLLAEHALYWLVDAINQHPDAGLIYSDEDKIDESGQRYAPHFKCELNYELLLAQNRAGHLVAYRTDWVRHVGGFRSGFEGCQDYDLVLRMIEKLQARQVIHIPHVLYHSRTLAAEDDSKAAALGRKAVTEHLERTGLSAEVMPAPEAPALNRVRFTRPTPLPRVTIIIPTRDRADLLGLCLDSLIQRSTYANYEVIIIDNGSVEAATQQLFERLPKDRFRILRDEAPFNFSALNNKAARLAKGDLFCLMNNDIEILTPDWLEEMVSFAVRTDVNVGCVGARLWYPDGRLQHGGAILGVGDVCGHAQKHLHRSNTGYYSRAILHQSFSVVTAACLLVRRTVFEQVNGLDEQLSVAFNDVDFCLRVREAGYRNVWTPYAEMNHHESASRGFDDTPAKRERFLNEVSFMLSRWGDTLLVDPAYSPNLTLEYEDFSYAWPPRIKPL